MTSLMAASMMGRTETAALLLERGADIKKRDRDGRSALMWAAQYGRLKTVELLLQRGADANAKDKRGNNALFWAKRSKARGNTKKKIEELLLNFRAGQKSS
jgi:ankyrin repeat protein